MKRTALPLLLVLAIAACSTRGQGRRPTTPPTGGTGTATARAQQAVPPLRDLSALPHTATLKGMIVVSGGLYSGVRELIDLLARFTVPLANLTSPRTTQQETQDKSAQGPGSDLAFTAAVLMEDMKQEWGGLAPLFARALLTTRAFLYHVGVEFRGSGPDGATPAPRPWTVEGDVWGIHLAPESSAIPRIRDYFQRSCLAVPNIAGLYVCRRSKGWGLFRLRGSDLLMTDQPSLASLLQEVPPLLPRLPPHTVVFEGTVNPPCTTPKPPASCAKNPWRALETLRFAAKSKVVEMEELFPASHVSAYLAHLRHVADLGRVRPPGRTLIRYVQHIPAKSVFTRMLPTTFRSLGIWVWQERTGRLGLLVAVQAKEDNKASALGPVDPKAWLQERSASLAGWLCPNVPVLRPRPHTVGRTTVFRYDLGPVLGHGICSTAPPAKLLSAVARFLTTSGLHVWTTGGMHWLCAADQPSCERLATQTSQLQSPTATLAAGQWIPAVELDADLAALARAFVAPLRAFLFGPRGPKQIPATWQKALTDLEAALANAAPVHATAQLGRDTSDGHWIAAKARGNLASAAALAAAVMHAMSTAKTLFGPTAAGKPASPDKPQKHP